MAALAGLLMLAAEAIAPGDTGHTPLICLTQEASAAVADVASTKVLPTILALLRGRECVFFPESIMPAVIFEEMVEHRNNLYIWRIKWGAEDWYVTSDQGPKPKGNES